MQNLTDEQAIQALAKTYARGFIAGDVQAIAHLMADTFVVLTPDQAPLTSREALEHYLETSLQQMRIVAANFDLKEIQVFNHEAHAWGLSEAEVCIDDSDTTHSITGKFSWLLTKGADQAWRLSRICALADL